MLEGQRAQPPRITVRGDLPVPSPTAVLRPRVMGLLTEAIGSHLITVVSAPAGMGKTTALSQWTNEQSNPVAWLSLSQQLTDRRHLYDALSTLLEDLVDAFAGAPAPARRRQQWRGGPEADLARLHRAFAAIDFPATLIIDDAHRAPPESPGALATMTTSLRVVLAGRDSTGHELSRLRLYGSVGAVDHRLLAFDTSEVAALIGHLAGRVDHKHAGHVQKLTKGWPVAVRLAVAGRDDDRNPTDVQAPVDSPALEDFVQQQILGQLSPDQADFVLRVAIVDEVDVALAAALSEREDSGDVLEECVRQGLFLDRENSTRGAAVYRWHPAFADQCRAILRRSRPEQFTQLSGRAATHLAEESPMAAVRHALHGGDPGLAVRIIEDHWLAVVIQSRAAELARLCRSLPRPWLDDPAILMIRAACLDVDGDRTGGRILLDRAIAMSRATPPVRRRRLGLVQALATLLVADERAHLVAAADYVEDALHRDHGLSPVVTACALFLLGWRNLRLRRDPPKTVQLLRAAQTECEDAGLLPVARQAQSNVAFAAAFAGDFPAADALLADLPDPTQEQETWLTVDGGQVEFSRGLLAYWRDDLDAAVVEFSKAVRSGGGRSDNYVGMALVFQAWTSAALGDSQAMADAAVGLRALTPGTVRGIPWDFYHAAAQARLAEVRGDHASATALLRPLSGHTSVPMTAAMIADVWRRCGHPDEALGVVDALAGVERAPFIRASLLLTEALVMDARGEPGRAQALLQRSLDTAVAHEVRRPYLDAGPQLRALLAERTLRGTGHEAFVGDLLARVGRRSSSPQRPEALSRREREIMGYLHTTMTNAEISQALFVSVNTLKTHKRAIYRKLNVNSRREAVRAYERAAWPNSPGEGEARRIGRT